MSEPAATLMRTDRSPARGRLREVALLFTRLGFTAFGGPAAHVAVIEDEVVQRRHWIDRAHFLDIVAAVNFIPGPNSTELAIHLGQLRAGFAGLVTAGVCFIAPAVLIILPIAWAYVTYGALPQVQPVLRSIGAAIVAIVAVATYRFLRTAITDVFTGVLCAVVIVGALLLHRFTHLQPEIVALAFAAVVGALRSRRPRRERVVLSLSPLALVPILSGEYGRMALFFLKVGATLFGSGYVLVSYLQSGLVDDHRWLTQRQLLDAIAVGQFTPGPLLTTATFVGFVVGHTTFAGGTTGGFVGAIVATVSIFLPSFVFVALLGPVLQRLRRNPVARGALDAMNAAVVGLMVVVAVRLALVAVFKERAHAIDWLNLLILACAATALLLWKLNATWIVLGAGLVGWVASLPSS
jgi:chromate transporter